MDENLQEALAFIKGGWTEPAANTLFYFDILRREMRILQYGGFAPIFIAFDLFEEDGMLWMQMEQKNHRLEIQRQPKKDTLTISISPGNTISLERAFL